MFGDVETREEPPEVTEDSCVRWKLAEGEARRPTEDIVKGTDSQWPDAARE